MTKFLSLFITMLKPKLKRAHLAMGGTILAILVFTVYGFFQGGINYIDWFSVAEGFAGISGTILFFDLLVRMERCWTASNYRLIPTSNVNFYLTNLLTTFITLVYFSLFHLMLNLIFNYRLVFETFSGHWSIVAYTILVLMLLVIFFLAFITMVHLITIAISAFLPSRGQKIYQILLAIGVLYIVSLFANVLSSLYIFDDASFKWQMTLIPAYAFVLGTIIIGINIYLLKNWIEVKPQD